MGDEAAGDAVLADVGVVEEGDVEEGEVVDAGCCEENSRRIMVAVVALLCEEPFWCWCFLTGVSEREASFSQ